MWCGTCGRPTCFTFRLAYVGKTSLQQGGPDEHLKTASDRHRFRRGLPVVLHRQAPHRERAGADAGGPVEIHWRPFFLNSWVPRQGISRDEYLTTKFGSPEAYKGIAGR